MPIFRSAATTIFALGTRMDSDLREVAIIAATRKDLELVQQLLTDVKHHQCACTGAPSIEKTAETHDVVIVCHRYSKLFPTPFLPADQKPNRLIVLSDRNDEQQVVNSLESGAHHYFNINEPTQVLSARLAAAMRRHSVEAMDDLEVLPFKFHVERRKVTRNGKTIHLSPREFSLAHFLFLHRDRIVLDTEIMVTIWALSASMDSRRIDTAVCRIRRKMDLYDNASEWRLHRLRQVGYQILSKSTPTITSAPINTARCRSLPKLVSVHCQTQAELAGNTSCKVFPNKSTISSSSASLAINGGAKST